jgi:hypothetical protein
VQTMQTLILVLQVGRLQYFQFYLLFSFLFELILCKLFINKKCLWNCLRHEKK